MNEGKKTGIFAAVAAVTLAIGLFVSWPSSTDEDERIAAGQPLFEEFKDPLSASSLKIVTFDEEQGQVATFEVRRDRESGIWSIPSRSGYPADAVEQMKDAANSLVGLQILDVQTRSAEDHEALGVVEPKLEDLEVGDVGVGRLVTFKDDGQKTLASLIIGTPVKDEDGKVYVRRPGQDPVYVVKLDESALSTEFEDWIEEDLLQISSIDIQDLTIKDYSTSMGPRGGVALSRNYTAELVMDGSDWTLERLLEFPSDNPLAEPTEVSVDAEQVVNKELLNDLKNALDDVRIVDVVRKPDGMSANLKADKDLVSDNEALMSLASRGFFPVTMGSDGESEMLSANGELTVSTSDGVEYVLRFGNVSGLTEEQESNDEEDEDAVTGGVNRYLLVTTRVDDSQFPAPELQPVPQTITELEALLGLDEKVTEEDVPVDMKPAEVKPEETAEEDAEATEDGSGAVDDAADAPMEAEATEETEEPTDSSDEPSENESKTISEPETAVAEPTEATVSGSGEATGEGQGQAEDGEDDVVEVSSSAPAEAGDGDEPNPTETMEEEQVSNEELVEDDEIAFADLSDEEKQERLEAEQEKVLKENTRRLDERKDRLTDAKRRVAELNARFADWYYVIPESTYSELRIARDDLLTTEESDDEDEVTLPSGGPAVPNFGN
ncbi:MAG: DUF4340 domain-containing protein [Planctomycetota bacterium]